jgi:hemin uptake protein HemP
VRDPDGDKLAAACRGSMSRIVCERAWSPGHAAPSDTLQPSDTNSGLATVLKITIIQITSPAGQVHTMQTLTLSASQRFRTPAPMDTSSRSGVGPADPLSRAMQSAELLRGNKVVEILHNGNVYRLQATRLGKLILTK